MGKPILQPPTYLLSINFFNCFTFIVFFMIIIIMSDDFISHTRHRKNCKWRASSLKSGPRGPLDFQLFVINIISVSRASTLSLSSLSSKIKNTSLATIRDEKVAEVWKKGIRKLTNNNKINNICPMQVFRSTFQDGKSDYEWLPLLMLIIC